MEYIKKNLTHYVISIWQKTEKQLNYQAVYLTDIYEDIYGKTLKHVHNVVCFYFCMRLV